MLRRGQAFWSCGRLPDTHGPKCCTGGTGFVYCAAGTVQLLLFVRGLYADFSMQLSAIRCVVPMGLARLGCGWVNNFEWCAGALRHVYCAE